MRASELMIPREYIQLILLISRRPITTTARLGAPGKQNMAIGCYTISYQAAGAAARRTTGRHSGSAHSASERPARLCDIFTTAHLHHAGPTELTNLNSSEKTHLSQVLKIFVENFEAVKTERKDACRNEN